MSSDDSESISSVESRIAKRSIEKSLKAVSNMSETGEAEAAKMSQHSDSEESQDANEDVNSTSASSEMSNVKSATEKMDEILAKSSKVVLDPNNPLMIKYQQDLKERLLNLLQETDEQLLDLKRTITAQEKENDHFAKQGYEFQKELCLQEEKLNKVNQKYKEQLKKKQELEEKDRAIKEDFKKVEEKLVIERKNDVEFQRKLEDISFQVVQLTSLQGETFTDAKSLQRAVEKSSKDRENLELQKLRQDLLICRLENDKYNLEDKISLYKIQWAIKKEEVADLRKELNAAHTEMELINYEKQQIVHQWRQSLASLEKQDRVLSEIRISARSFEDDMQTLNMEIAAYKKSVRKELERNEMLTVTLQFRDSDIARTERELKDFDEKENNLIENISVIEKVIAITEDELKYLNDNVLLKEKELEAKEREIQKYFNLRKSLEEKYMDILHQKMTITKASKHTEKLIKDTKISIDSNEKKGSKKENEREKFLLQIDNLKTYLAKLEENFEELKKERKQRGDLLDKSEANVLKTREKIDARHNDYKNLENELQELIFRAGGQELAPFERELANLRKEITTAEQGKRDMEQEYLRFQQELFTLSKQNSQICKDIDVFKKRIVIMEGKKLQLQADIAKEEKDIKDIHNRIICVEKEITHINKLLNERKDLQEYLKHAKELSKSDFNQTLKEAELNYLQKQSQLKYLHKQKRKKFCKVMETQKYIIFWEQKVQLAKETRRILKSESHLDELYDIKSEIRRLQLKQQQIKKEQDSLVQEMGKAVYRHTSLYVEADKQALMGKRRKTSEYVKKRIKHNLKKIVQDKKTLEKYKEKIESFKTTESQLEAALKSEECLIAEIKNKINSMEHNTDSKQQEKRQALIRLSFKQKKSKLLQKVKDNSYVRAIRNDDRRSEEILKIQNCLRGIQVIVQAAMSEYPSLSKDLSKVYDHILVSKEF